MAAIVVVLASQRALFSLAKWYLDLVTDEGTAIMGYAARLGSGPVRVGYSSVLVSIAGAPLRESSAFGEVDGPRDEEEVVTWQQPALDVRGRWQRLAPPITQRLVQTPDGEICWHCVTPRSLAQIDIGDTRYNGVGYVEHLTLTLPPWRLPFNFLRWGRYASASRSIVWIAWRGAEERCFIWDDGLLRPAAVLGARSIHGLTGGAELQFGEPRDVCARPPLARLMDRLPKLARPLAAPVAAMVEHKMVAPSRVLVAGDRLDSGWSVFEDVQW